MRLKIFLLLGVVFIVALIAGCGRQGPLEPPPSLTSHE